MTQTSTSPERRRIGRTARFAAAAVVALAGIGVTASSASAATDLGGVSVAAYCARNVSSGTLAPSIATNINNRWDGWRCGTRVGLVGVDMNLACRQQYYLWYAPWANAWANHTSDSMFSWRCYR